MADDSVAVSPHGGRGLRSLPLPVAAALQSVTNVAGAERRNRVLAAGDTVLRYLVAVLLSDYVRGPATDKVTSLLRKLRKPALGTWGTLAVELARAISERASPAGFAMEGVAALVGSGGEPSELASAIKTFVEARNDLAHHNGPAPPAEEAAERSLQTIAQCVSWLEAYRVIEVVETRVRPDSSVRGRLRCYRGNQRHPSAQEFTWDGALATGCCYLLDASGTRALLVHPFVQVLDSQDSNYRDLCVFARAQGPRLDLRDDLGRTYLRDEPSEELFECDRADRIAVLRATQGALSLSRAEGETGTLMLGRFPVIDRLGSGGMATVYRVRDTDLGRDYALKILDPELADNQLFVARFEREAQIMASLDSPNIARVHEAGRLSDGQFFLRTELAEHGDLAKYQGATFAAPTVTSWAKQLLGALATIHDQDLVHRDIKPANILQMSDTRLALTDFGIAFQPTSDTRLTRTAAFMASVAYAAPEQLDGVEPTTASDIFSLGLVLDELLHGKRRRATAGIGVGGRLGETIRAMTRNDPTARPGALAALGLLSMPEATGDQFAGRSEEEPPPTRERAPESKPSSGQDPSPDTTAAQEEKPTDESGPVVVLLLFVAALVAIGYALGKVF